MKVRGALACAAVVAACAGCGSDGTDGMNGDDGRDGRDGTDGTDGTDGKDGTDGTDGTDGESVEIQMLDVGDPDCPNGGTAFTVGGDTTYACNGEMGARGDAGVEGPQGIPGDYQPVTSILCSTVLDVVDASQSLSSPAIIGTDGIAESVFGFRATIYSNGDVLNDCSGSLGTVETAAGGGYLPAVTQGAADVGCSYGLNYPPTNAGPGNAGFWLYEVDATGPIVTYRDDDVGHPLDGDFYRFTDDDCVIRRVDGDGDWATITIADL